MLLTTQRHNETILHYFIMIILLFFSSVCMVIPMPGDTLPAIGGGVNLPQQFEPELNLDYGPPLQVQKFTWPTSQGKISSPFGNRIHPITKKQQFHTGIDIALPINTPIKATADGIVSTSAWMGGFGWTIIIEHENNISTLYAHLNSNLVKKGDRVISGQTIALSGNTGNSTGPHLHFEIRIAGEHVDPLIFFN